MRVPARPTTTLPAHWVEALVCAAMETTSTSGGPVVKIWPGSMATARAKGDVDGVGETEGEGDRDGVFDDVTVGGIDGMASARHWS